VPDSFLARLRARVNRGSSWVADLLPGRRIDAALLDELETRLLAADVGVEATETILADLHRRVARSSPMRPLSRPRSRTRYSPFSSPSSDRSRSTVLRGPS
jgi:signal recognition particle GTPase